MAYDFHNPNSDPGAITPFDKLKQVVKYSSSIVPVEKINSVSGELELKIRTFGLN